MTFLQWLKSQEKRADPVGDFARDVAIDKDKPKGAKAGKADWSAYLESIKVMDKVVDAFNLAWAEFEVSRQ